MIRKRLYRRRMNVRIKDLRDYYATFIVRHGLIKEEVDRYKDESANPSLSDTTGVQQSKN
jgi:hypothetical protein